MWAVWDKRLEGRDVDGSLRSGAVLPHLGLIANVNRMELAAAPSAVNELSSDDGVPRYALIGTVRVSGPGALLLLDLGGLRILVDLSGCATVKTDDDTSPSLIDAAGQLTRIEAGLVMRATGYLEVVDHAAWDGLLLPEARTDWIMRSLDVRPYVFGRPSSHSDHLVLLEDAARKTMRQLQGQLVLVDLEPVATGPTAL